jgi:hypothetical protein
MDVEARLDKTKERVLCGTPGCGLRLVTIFEGPNPDPVPIGMTKRYVTVEPGWHMGKDGVYVLNLHARKQWRRDQQIASTGKPGDARTQQAKQRLADGTSWRNRKPIRRTGDPGAMYAWDREEQAFHPYTTLSLPARMRCPDCTRTNVLQATALEIDTGTEQTRQRLDDDW